MKHLPLISSICSTPRRKLYMAIAAQMIFSAGAQAAPNGGTVVGGDGIIEQSGVDTTIIQNTDHLAIDWESFNIAAEERVQFIQPDADSVALNRILGNEASQIFGRLDANGHVILMNPNGVLFGEGASVNVGGLVATGLNINADDFMNGEFVLQAVDGKDGTVINKGIINAATGGSVALIGKQVDNQGLISAKLGSVTLAAGKEAVLTFDNQGLLGVRVSKEILQDEIGVDAAVANSGDITAEGGRILLTGSVSQDIFSQAVNADGLNAKTSVVMHEDGSFTLGAGADVVNTGTINASSETAEAGQIVVLGENVESSGAILANSKTASTTGNIEVHSRDTTLLTEDSTTSATNNDAGSGGQIKILGDRVGILDQSQINTSGTDGGGDINIGGGFQGKETQLRNATRTVVGKDTLIEANAISEGDGGDVIVWADETTSFTGEINVRGGELGGDGGFVEVSGKENLRFLGSVDRTAVRGENGTLLLDPEYIEIVTETVLGIDQDELNDSEILFDDPPDAGGLRISDLMISEALSSGDVILQATREISTFVPGSDEPSINSTGDNSLIMESGGVILLGSANISLGGGSLILSSGLQDCGEGSCWIEIANPSIANRISLSDLDLVTTGNLIVKSRGSVDLSGTDFSVTNLDIASYKGVTINTLYDDASIDVAGTMNIVAGSAFSPETVVLPSGQIYTTPVQTAPSQGEVIVGSVRLNGDLNVTGETNIRSSQGIAAELSARLNLLGDVFLDADGSIRFLRNGDISTSILNPGGNVYLRSGGNIEFYTSTDYAISESGLNRFILPESSTSSFTLESGGNIQIGELEIGDGNILIDATAGIDLGQISGGDINLISQQDIVLPTIVSGGDLNVESTLGSVSFSGVLNVGGDTSLSAAEDIVFLAAGAGESDVPASIFSENGDVRLSARNVNMGSWDENHTPLDIGGSFTVNFEEFARIKGVLNVGGPVEISTQTGMLSLGWGSINTLGSFSANLADGSYDGGLETGGFMSINAGQIDIIGSELLLADVELNGDSTLGTGDINITITGDGEFAYPSINRQRLVTTGNLNIDLQSSGATTRFYGDESSAINVDGAATISAIGDLIIPDLDVKGDLSVTSAQGGITFTKSTFEAPTLSSLVTVEGDATLRAGAAVLLTEGSSLNVAGETKITSEDDISFLETSIFLPGDNVYLTSGNDISFAASSNLNDPGFIELAESSPASFIFSAGRNVVIDSTLTLGAGDFVASAGTRAHSPSDFPVQDASLVVRSHEGPGIYAKAVDTNGKIIFRSAHFIDTPILESGANGAGGYIGYYTDGSVVLPHYANSNGHFEVFNYSGAENLISTFQLSDGSTIELPNIDSFESSDAGYVGWYGSGVENTLATSGGNFYIEARAIQHWGGNALDVSSSFGHGNITLIAAEEIQAPPMIYSNLLGPGADQFSEIRLSASKVRIDRDIDFNNAGVVDFSLEAGGDVIIGVVEDDLHYLELSAFNRRVGGKIFDSSGGDSDQLNLQITSGGTVFQKYDLFTGGGNYSATASEFQFNDLIALNTDFANETQNALSGSGNVSIQSTSDQAELVLPGITTQTDCVDKANCGTLNVSAASVDNKGELRIFGDANFDVVGTLSVANSYFSNSVGTVSLNNYFDGRLSADAAIAIIGASGSLELGEWNLTSTEGQSMIVMADMEPGSDVTANERMIVAGRIVLAGAHVEVKNSETIFGELLLGGNSVDIEYSGDLNLVSAYLLGGADGSTSRFTIGGNLTVPQSGDISGENFQDPDPVPHIIFDVTGNIALLGERNRLSSIQILNAQNAEIFNNGELTLNGVNAESLTLNVLGDIEQTGALNILGATNINASFGASINLLDPLNDFNSLNVQAAGPAIINIADANSISLADIDLNGASQGGALSVRAANIIQEDNGRILLQDATRLNLQADYITLGANGTASVDILGSTLNGVFTRDLNIQGVVRGGAGVAGTGVAGFYFNGSVEDNFFEVADGASITGDFISGSEIHMGDGNDTASLAGDIAIPVEGGAGQDTFVIQAPTLSVAQILGQEDQDILVGPDADNFWVVSADGEGTLSNGTAVINFSGIDSIRGGSQTDDFIVESLTAALQIDAGNGLDSLSANLNDPSINNQWLVDGINSGSLNEIILFTSLENLIGNDGADTVTFAESAQIGDVSTGLGDDIFTLAADITTGLLDAGEGRDTLNLNGLNSIYNYLNQRIGGDGNYTTAGIEVKNSQGGSKTVVGIDGYEAEWVVDGDGSLTVNAQLDGITRTNRFTEVTRVEGGSGDDTFILRGGIIAGSIVGGQGGNDSLIADTSLANTWLLDGPNSGKVQVVEADREQVFEAINNLVGGSDNDIFNILSGANFNGTIIGGEGANSLIVLDPMATSVWTIASTNDLRVESSANTASQVTFSDIELLIGNSNEDVLDLSAVGGSVDLKSSSASGFYFQNFDTFISDGGNFLGTDSNTSWILNEVSEIRFQDQNGIEQRYSFSGFRGIHGGSGEDYFRIDGRWSAIGGQIFAESLSESPDTAELNLDVSSAWNFNSGDSTELYLDVSSVGALFASTRSEALNALAGTGNPLILLGIENNIGGNGDDIFLVYGDTELYDPFVDGSGGNDYLVAYNWGTPEDLIWNVTEDYGGDINAAVQFRDFENLRSFDFFDADTRGVVSRFNISAGVAIDSLVGDSTNTTFNVGAQARIGSIADNGGTDTINVSDGINAWQLGEASGSLNSTTFAGIEILNGGAGSDNFTFSSATTEITQIDGGAGVNSLTAFNQDNTWNLSASASTLNVDLQFNNITNLIGNAGADTFVITEAVPDLNIDGGAGTNTLIANRDNTLNNTWTIDGVNSGTLNTNVQFSSIQDLQGNDGIDTVTFAADSAINNISTFGGDDVVFMASGVQAGLLDGGLGDNVLNLGDLNTVVDILGRTLEGGDAIYEAINFTPVTGGDGLFTVRGLAGINAEWLLDGDNAVSIRFTDNEGVAQERRYTNVSRMEGADGTNRFVLTADGSLSGQIVGGTSLTAANNQDNVWLIDGADSGTLTSATSQQLVFQGIANLIGGTGADIFEIATAGSITGSIDGGAGNDRLVITDAAAINDWLLSAQNSVGVVAQFRGIESLVGNANNDTFSFGQDTDIVSVAGGEGFNTIRFSGSDNVLVRLETGDIARNVEVGGELVSSRLYSFDLINRFESVDGVSGFLYGADVENNWVLEAIGSGRVNEVEFFGFEFLVGGSGIDTLNGLNSNSIWNLRAGEAEAPAIHTLSLADAPDSYLHFSDFEAVIAGSESDDFRTESLVDLSIDGGAGVDSLQQTLGVEAQTNSWLVNSEVPSTLNEGLRFLNVENLQGGAGNDTFTFTANSSIGNINAGAGDDTFVLANNITAGILDGGDGLDILDRAGLNSIVTYLREVIGGDAVYTAANIETETSSGGSTTVVGVDGYNAEWRITGSGTLSVTATDASGVAVTNEFQDVTRAQGGAGLDAFVLLDGGALADGIVGDGSDNLQASETTNTWTINAADGGELAVQEFGTRLAFQGIANLYGGNGSDIFDVVAGGSVSGSIYGSGGVDTLIISDAAAVNNWQLGEANSVGGVADFREIETLVGNGNDDTFTFTGPTAVVSVDGGVGDNAIIWRAGDVSINLGTAQMNDAISFTGINSFDAEPTANNRLLGADQENVWTLSGNNAGMVNSIRFTGFNQLQGGAGQDVLVATDSTNRWSNVDAASNTLNDNLLFSAMEQLVGGAQADEFSTALVDVTALDGGLGDNQLVGVGAGENSWIIDGANSGTVNTTLAFERIQNLIGGAGSDTFSFAANSGIESIDAGDGDDTFVLANNITAGLLDGGAGQDTLDRGGLNSIVTYLREVIGGDAVYTAANIETETSAGGSTTVVAVDGYDARWLINGDGSISVTAVDANGVSQTNEFSSVTRLEGGSGADEFVLLSGGAVADGIIGSGDDTLQASDTTNTWTINAANAGELVAQEDGTTLLFQGIANLLGGSGSDLFNVVAGGSIAGSIDGGAGADRLVISDESLANNWQLGLQNSVNSVAQFRGIETVVGNGGDDRFAFTAATDVTSVEGNAGNNALLWSAGDLVVNLGTGLLNDQIRFVGVNSFEADASTTNTMVGADENNTWTLNGALAGLVANTGGSTAFNGFQSLVGGALADAFVLSAEAAGFGVINGETGADTLTAANQLNEWLLDAEGGELNGLRFANIETLTGGALQDNFVLADTSSQAQTIDGGAGANRLTGYDQANAWNVTGDNAGDLTGLGSFSNIQTLIGGAQADTFTLAAGVNLSEIYAGAGNDMFVIGAGVVADNFYGEAGDDSVEVAVGLVLSGVLDGGSGGETDGDYIDLSQYTLLDATAELESVLGFAFRNFERIDEPNNQGVYFGGNGTNFWYITGANEGRLEIRDGEDAGVYEFTGVHSLLGGEGEDIFIFANDSAAVTTLIDGGNGAGANTLDLSAQGLINEWLLSGANSGSVSNASNTNGNVFINIAYLIGGSNRDVFDLQAGGSIAGAIDGGLGGDELLVSVEQTSNWQLGGVGGHSVTGVASFTNIESLVGGAGIDNFDVLAELTDVTQLAGGAGSDAVNFLYEAPVTVDLVRGLAGGLLVEGIERFTSVDAGSALIGVDSATAWSIDGTDRGTIRYLLETSGEAINVAFDGFGNLRGGAGDDQFVFAQAGALSGTLSGGDGRNSVDLQQVVGELHVAVAPDVAIANGLDQLILAGIDQLIGNGQTWLYGAGDRSYTWTIDRARSGQMTSTLVDDNNRPLAFENLSAIRGGAHDDIFQVMTESPLLSLDGGAAVTADLVDYSRVNGNLRINLASALSGQNGVLTGVEGIRGNNAGPNSLHNAELVGPDNGATWSIGDLDGDGLADGVNDGEVVFGEQTITFIDFNLLTGGAGADTFNQTDGIVLGTLNGGAEDDTFNIDVGGANAGTRIIGGTGNDSLLLRGGDAAGLMTYTAAANGGEFDYALAEAHYRVSHEDVETLRDRTLANALDIRGSSAAETFTLANGRFWVNGGDVVEYSNKRDIAVRSGINDIIEIADNLVIENTLTLANGTVIANDPANNSISAAALILDSTRDVGLSSARLRTSVDDLFVRNSAGDIYLQEQNGLNLAEFNANGVFDLLLLNGDLTNSAPLMAADVFRVVANNGDITLTGANQLRDDVAVTGDRVELHNASTLTLIEVNAEELYLRTQRDIEGDGPITVAGLTDIDAQGDVFLDFTTNDFNQVRVSNAVDLTLVDQNAIELLDINASGRVIVRSTNTVTLNDNVTGANGVDVSSGNGSVNQNGSVSTNNGSVAISAGNGEINLGEDARIVSNGGSVSINAGAGNVNMGGDTRIAANGGDVNIVAADSVVVAEVVSSGNVSINAGSGSISDGNGGATNVSAGGLQGSSNTGFGSGDALETNVGNIDITTNTGNVAVSNSGNVSVDKVSTGQGDISLVNQGDVELGSGSVVAQNGANGGSVNIDVSQGSVSQSGSTDIPAVKGGGTVVINAPDGAIGEGGGLRVDAPFVEIIAAIKAGDIFVNPGADKIEYFSGSFKFEDQMLAVEPLDDINPAIFANVKSYFFNDISLLLPRDQLYDEDEEE